MAIAKVNLINLTAPVSNLDRVLSRFVDVKQFHPVLASEIVEKVHGLTSFISENPCIAMLENIADIETKYDLKLPDVEQKDENYNLNEMSDYIEDLKVQLDVELNQIRELEAHIERNENALIQVRNIESLDVPLDDLFACQYIFIRFGRLPNDSIDKLKFFENKPFVFKSFNYDQNYSWCMYFTTDEYKREIDNIFSSLFFERVFIPDFVHGTPKEAVLALEHEIALKKNEILKYRNDICSITDGCENRLAQIKGELLFLSRMFEAKKYVVGLGNKFSISGFMEKKDVKQFQKAFEGIDDVEIEINDAEADRRITPPTKLKNGWFSRPFGMFVEMYGLPSYHEIDPTPFVAITYSLLFGMMFGDLGQGLVLALLGFFLWKKKGMRLGAIGVRVGISSAIFGFLYGSFFGNETILTPIFTNVFGLVDKPIDVMNADFTMTLLITAVALGALIIVTSIVLNIITLIRKKEYVELICSHNGVSGFMLYGYILAGVALQFGLGVSIFNIFMMIPFIILPIALILFKEPIHRKVHGHAPFPGGVGGFLVEGFFEIFEIMLSYMTNTMSFLRVGGFILSHAGMMLVVESLMHMAGNASWVVLILGNIFVMALEGMIVGIQVLRLEFYEMFSRYYSGNGSRFTAMND